MLRTKGIKTS